MTIESTRYEPAMRHDDGPLFSSLDVAGGIVAAAMLLLPLTAGGTHYSKVGWDPVQMERSR